MPNISVSQPRHFAVSPENLALYEVQRSFIEPMLRLCRLWNTTFDMLFYDVGLLTMALLTKGTIVVTEAIANSNSPTHPLTILDLTAQSNPSGSIIIVDANQRPM